MQVNSLLRHTSLCVEASADCLVLNNDHETVNSRVKIGDLKYISKGILSLNDLMCLSCLILGVLYGMF